MILCDNGKCNSKKQIDDFIGEVTIGFMSASQKIDFRIREGDPYYYHLNDELTYTLDRDYFTYFDLAL